MDDSTRYIDRQRALQHARYLLKKDDATGDDFTAARVELASAFDGHDATPEYLRMRRELADARHLADIRDGLRCNGRPRKPRAVGFLRKGGPNNAA